MAGKSGSAVLVALLGNGFLTVIKFIAFLLSRSPAMLSESIHSFADTSNQALLFIGMRRSERPADERYHWGYGNERFLFALFSAMGIFVLGCGVTVYHGVSSFIDPPTLSLNWITFAVLGISFVVDGYVFSVALREVNRLKGEKSIWRFLRESSDPTLLAVLFEDFVATVGVVVAFVGILLAHLLGIPELDALSSIIIGLMLGVVAIWLGVRNSALIIGPSVPREIEDEIVAFLREQPSIENVRKVRSRLMDSEHFALSAKIDYNGVYLGRLHAEWVRERVAALDEENTVEQFSGAFGERLFDALAVEVDRLERELRKRFPMLEYLDLESDDVERFLRNNPGARESKR